MKRLLFLLSTLLIVGFTYGQQKDESNKNKVSEEIKALFAELNQAMAKHDRVALEKIYADEFLFIHGFGFIDNKTVQINSIMETDPVPAIPIPSLDQLYVYGDVAVLRLMTKNPVGGNNLMSTNIFAKKDGRWQYVQVQSTQQQRERKTVKVSTDTLDLYRGKYQQVTGGDHTVVVKENEVLIAQTVGRPKRILSATSATQFFDKFGSSLTFYKDETGRITHFVLRSLNGQETKWNKIE